MEVFWKLWRNPRTHGPGAGGWLYRTAVRVSLDELRRQSRREKYERLFSFAPANPTPEQLHSEKEDQYRVRKVLAAISVRQAELLVLRSEGMSYQEIARVLDLNPGSHEHQFAGSRTAVTGRNETSRMHQNPTVAALYRRCERIASCAFLKFPC